MSYLKSHMSFSMTRKASWISWKIKKRCYLDQSIYAYFFQQILPLKSLSMNSSSSSDCSASKCVSSLSSRWLWSRELEWDEFDEPTEKKKFKALWNIRPNPFSKCHATLHKGWPLPKWFYFKTTFRTIMIFFYHLILFLSQRQVNRYYGFET